MLCEARRGREITNCRLKCRMGEGGGGGIEENYPIYSTPPVQWALQFLPWNFFLRLSHMFSQHVHFATLTMEQKSEKPHWIDFQFQFIAMEIKFKLTM